MKISEQKDPSGESIKFILELFNSNKINEAKNEIDKQLIKYPHSSILLNILGAVFASKNKLNLAIENYKKAININSNYAQAHNNLGIALHKFNKPHESIPCYKKAINLKNDFAEAYNNLGNALREIGSAKESLQHFEKAIKIKPDYTDAFYSLGGAHQDLGNKLQALENFKKTIKIKPDYAEVYNNLGLLFEDLSRFEDSLSYYNKAINLKPNDEKTYNNLGNLLNHLGKYDEATKAFYKALKIKPNYPKAYSNLLFNLNYKIDFDPNEYLKEAKNFRLNCKTIKKEMSFKYQYEKNPKKLKIGLVSADFGNHPGGFFTLSTLKELRNMDFELIAYATTNRKDELSSFFRPLFHKWHSVEKKNDEEVVQQIFNDGIHILMDLQGHSAHNRLTVFMYKPAPIQATWLGQGSSGISEIDYFVGSPHTTPQNEENHYVEKIFRLPEISQCFTPPNFDIKINDLPALKNNYVTFGCFNKISKINSNVIALWSKILLSIPNSKIILKNKDLDNKKIFTNISQSFEKYNVKKNRIILLGESKTRRELLEVYNKVDISLDPFPFQGNTSSCESVWMGVPVIVLKGNRYLFHFGESINSNLNMENWIAKNEEEYVSKAVKFSSELQDLSKIRKSLRGQALDSPIFNAPRFASHFSKMLWNMWNTFNG